MRRAARCVLGVSISLMVLCPISALADGVFVDPCGQTDNFIGPSSQTFVCPIGIAGSSTSAGGAIAGFDFFINHISPVHLSGFQPGEFIPGIPYRSISFPGWDVVKTSTFLELDGTVRVDAHDPTAFITLTLIGILGGCVNPADPGCVGGNQQLGPYTFHSGTWDLGFSSTVEQFTAPVARERLIIDVNGNVTYNVNGSPEFAGSAPEPKMFFLFGAGSLLCALRAFWTRNA